jgi:integrase
MDGAMDAVKHKPLTALDVRNLPVGLHQDGEVKGLYLRVLDTGARGFLLRYMIAGRRRDMWLGSSREITLARARDDARQARELIRNKIDPLVRRHAEQAENKRQAGLSVWTFKRCAQAVHETLLPGWKNAKHGDQWINTLATYAFPKIGERPVGELAVGDMLDVLRPVWTTKAETARRIRQRLDAVMRWAVAHGYAASNPVDAAVELLPRQKKEVDHHAAMPHAEVGAFVRELRAAERAAGNLALLFTILTAARSGEVRGATWAEVDLQTKVWTVPAERMKAGRAQRVPLSDQACNVLEQARERFATEGLIFPGAKGKPISDMTMAAALKRRGLNFTVHGFRSSFRDWCADTGVSREVAERALAHAVKDATEAAYHRTDQLEQRRPVMQAWAAYLHDQADGRVVPLRGGA